MSSDFKPTLNVVVEPHPSVVDVEKEFDEPAAEKSVPFTPIKPHRQKAFMEVKREPLIEIKQEPQECCPVASDGNYDAMCLFKALGAAFFLGAFVGAVVSLSFSSQIMPEE